MMEGIKIEVIQRETELVENVPYCKGLIQINNFLERFTMPLAWWSCEHYEQQWQEGFKRLKTYDVSCLVSCVQLADDASFINRWILYKEGNTIYVRNHILFGKDFAKKYMNTPFNLETCYQFINPRKPWKRGKYQVSEWSFPLSSLNLAKDV